MHYITVPTLSEEIYVLTLTEAWYRSAMDPCLPPHTEIKDEESGSEFLGVKLGVGGTGRYSARQTL
jgi:hypothetical protein